MSSREMMMAARALRRRPAAGEVELWAGLRGSRLGVKFRRQHVIGGFVVDFACLDPRVVVEVDGPVHGTTEMRMKDAARDAALRVEGYVVVRVSSAQVLDRRDEVLAGLRKVIERSRAVSCPLPPERERVARSAG